MELATSVVMHFEAVVMFMLASESSGSNRFWLGNLLHHITSYCANQFACWIQLVSACFQRSMFQTTSEHLFLFMQASG